MICLVLGDTYLAITVQNFKSINYTVPNKALCFKHTDEWDESFRDFLYDFFHDLVVVNISE